MTSTRDRPAFIEVRLSLLAPAEGGRDTPIRTGYMPNWWLPGRPEPILASAAIELLDSEELAPGASASARVHPFAAELWQSVGVGAENEVTEGPERAIGKAVVTRVVPAAVPVG